MQASAVRAKSPRILIVNASLTGVGGNTTFALERLRKTLTRKADVRTAVIAESSFEAAKEGLAWAEGVVFGTGTHWDSWSSVLQKFLEDATQAEGTTLWLGKPAACVVTEHSVGGKGVLSRLQGVLVTLGCMIPPMSGVVLSKVAQIAAERVERDNLAAAVKRAKTEAMMTGGAEDFWCADDLKIVAHNLVEAVTGGRKWKAWPVDREDFAAKWMRG